LFASGNADGAHGLGDHARASPPIKVYSAMLAISNRHFGRL